MPEHRIRLRGAWDRFAGSEATPSRVDLPILWSDADGLASIRLVRRFGRPRSGPVSVSIGLEMADVGGLRAIQLNGQTLDWLPGTAEGGVVRLDLSDLIQERNTLELELDLSGVDRTSPWGSIALVIGGETP